MKKVALPCASVSKVVVLLFLLCLSSTIFFCPTTQASTIIQSSENSEDCLQSPPAKFNPYYNSTEQPIGFNMFNPGTDGVQPLSDPSQAFTLSDTGELIRSPPADTLTNYTLSVNNKTLSNQTEFTFPTPGVHSCWGTRIKQSSGPFTGVFAQQFFSTSLSLASPSPDEAKRLFAPTLTLPVPCPLEVAIDTCYNAPGTLRHISIMNLKTGTWASSGQTDGNCYIDLTGNSPFIFNQDPHRSYVYVEIHKFGDMWRVYLWDRVQNNWVALPFEETDCDHHAGYVDDGWNFFEAVNEADGGYDEAWAQVCIEDPVSSQYLRLDRSQYSGDPRSNNWVYPTSYDCEVWYDFPTTASPGLDFVQQHNMWGYKSWDVFSLLDPPISVLAYDDSSGTYIDGVPFYVNSSFAGVSISTVELPAGNITLEVPDYGCWNYTDINGTAIYDNPTNITLVDGFPVVAIVHYTSWPNVTLNVNAFEDVAGGNYSLNPDVYIDDNYAGTAPLSVNVTVGFHNVWVNDSLWSSNIDDYVYFAEYTYNDTFQMSSTMSNPEYILVNMNSTTEAYYRYGWVSSIDSWEGADYPENLLGGANDDQWASLCNVGAYYVNGTILGVTNREVCGHIWVYGYLGEYSSTPGKLSLDVSEDGEDWIHISTQYIESATAGWIDCGAYPEPFNYIMLSSDDLEAWSFLMIDSVRIYSTANCSLTISNWGNGYTDPAPDTYAYLETTNVNVTGYPDSGYLTCWYLDDTPYSINDSVIVTMDTNHTLEAHFVNESYLTQLGNTEICGGTYMSIGDQICGQAFTSPIDGFTQTVTAALILPFTESNYTVKAAIYSRSDFTLLAQSEPTEISRAGEPEWQWYTFFLTSSVALEADQDYILVVWAPSDYAYGIFIASDTTWEFNDGYNIYCEWHGESDGVLPNPLCEYECSEYRVYSIYSTVIPYT